MFARTCSIVAVIALAAPAAADPAGADRMEREAEALVTSGDFVAAATKYRDAYREYPRPDLMCNVGVAYYKAKDLPRAHRYLDQCVTTGSSLDRAFIDNVKAVLTAVEQKLQAGEFKPLNFIIQPPSATTTFASGIHDESLVGSRQVWVPFGTYQVTIHAEGYIDRVVDIQATGRDPGEYSVKLEPSAPGTVPPGGARLPVLPERPAPAERSLVAPIVASAATGVLGGLALGFYVAARGSASDANGADVSLESYNVSKSDAESRQHLSWIFGGVAGVGAIAAVVLWVRATRSPAPVEVSTSASSATLSVVGRW